MPDNVKQLGSAEEQLAVMFTWIGLNRLKTHFKSNKNEWKLVAKKAEHYLSESVFQGAYEDIVCTLFK